MPPEISLPTEFKFWVFLSHAFPGFFSALSMFMLIYVLTPFNLASWTFGTITNFLSVMGFIIILGTIFGVIIDGVHHAIIESKIFVKCSKSRKLEEEQEFLYPSRDIRFFYYSKLIGTDVFTYLADDYYRYSEFYANIAISLIPFSCISPFYLCYILKISYLWSIILGFIAPLVLACFCIWRSYAAFLEYHRHRRDTIYGFLRLTKSIEVTADLKSITVHSLKCLNITAQLKGKVSDFHKRGVKIIFKTTLGQLNPNQKETNEEGKATVQLKPDDPGIAIVTASSEDFISGNVDVEVKKKKMKETTLRKWYKEYKPLFWGVFILIIIAGVFFLPLFLFFTPKIIFEPQKLDVSISPGDSIVKTISIGAIGRGNTVVTLNATEPIDKWVNFSKNKLTVEVGKTHYVNVHLDIPSNTPLGEYKGAIEISHKHGKAEIPVLVKIKQIGG